MVDYEQTIQKIITSIINFTFEFDIEEVKNRMKLQEISDEEIKKIGGEKVSQNFRSGIFKIKLSDGKIIDYNSIFQHCNENNIKEPLILLNPNFKYVRWQISDSSVQYQLKKEVKQQLSSSSQIELEKIQKSLIEEETKNQKIVGYINKLPIKTSDIIKEGKFYIQSSCSKESASILINEVIEELKLERNNYVKEKLQQDKLIAYAYLVFMLIILIWWWFTNQDLKIPKGLSIGIGLLLFIAPFITSFINHSFIDSILFKNKAKNKYEREFNN